MLEKKEKGSDIIANFRITQNNKKAVINRTNDAIDRALMIIGMKGSANTAKITPVDTGNLKGSIDYVVNSDQKYVAIGSNVQYSVFQELGTIKMQAANKGKGFLRPAIKASMGEFNHIINEELRNV